MKDHKELFQKFFNFCRENTEVTKEILESFKDGHHTGYYWPDEWKYRPGGPWVSNCSRAAYDRSHHCEYCDKAALSAIKHSAWMAGWDIGHTEKLKEGRNNPPPTSEEIDEFNKGKRKQTLGPV